MSDNKKADFELPPFKPEDDQLLADHLQYMAREMLPSRAEEYQEQSRLVAWLQAIKDSPAAQKAAIALVRKKIDREIWGHQRQLESSNLSLKIGFYSAALMLILTGIQARFDSAAGRSPSSAISYLPETFYNLAYDKTSFLGPGPIPFTYCFTATIFTLTVIGVGIGGRLSAKKQLRITNDYPRAFKAIQEVVCDYRKLDGILRRCGKDPDPVASGNGPERPPAPNQVVSGATTSQPPSP